MNTTQQDNTQEFCEQPGLYLSRLRESKGWTLEYVAEKLRLRTQLLASLEMDDYAALPEPVFVKGYYRAYARVLEVDPEPCIQAFVLLVGAEPDVSKTHRPSMPYQPLKRKSRFLTWSAVTILLLILIIGIGLLQVYHAPAAQSDATLTRNAPTSSTQLTQVDRLQSLFDSAPVKAR